MRKIFHFLLMLLLLLSCRPQGNLYYDYTEEITTWEDLFKVFWNKMNTNYVFWSEESVDWDDVYNEYIDTFISYGSLKENVDEAFRSFFNITKDLTDGHLTAVFNVNENYLYLSPSLYRIMKGYGMSDSLIFALLSYDKTALDDPNNTAFLSYYNASKETIENVLNYTFNFNSSTRRSNNSLPLVTGCYQSDNLTIIVATNTDNIVYLGLSSFTLTEEIKLNDDVTNILLYFYSLLNTASAVILDLRGNTGGYVNDLEILLPLFTDKTVRFADSRRKLGDNRNDYGAWLALEIEGVGISLRNIPIAVLFNNFTASSAESTVLFFKALSDYHNYNVKTFGETSVGAFGSLLDDGYENYYNAGSTSVEPYLTILYTPFTQVRYASGEIFEGKGIVPDEEITFNYDEFSSGTDRKLNAALSWILTQ